MIPLLACGSNMTSETFINQHGPQKHGEKSMVKKHGEKIKASPLSLSISRTQNTIKC
jgi:hypothetical protein